MAKKNSNSSAKAESIKSFKNETQLQNEPDGLIHFNGILENCNWENEKTFSDHFEKNIHAYSIKMFDDETLKYDREFKVSTSRLQRKNKSVDFVIQGVKAQYIIEIKHPKYVSENLKALGQLMNYGRHFLDTQKKELILITTKFDFDTAETIEYYDLPIRYFYVNKLQVLEFKNMQYAR